MAVRATFVQDVKDRRGVVVLVRLDFRKTKFRIVGLRSARLPLRFRFAFRLDGQRFDKIDYGGHGAT